MWDKLTVEYYAIVKKMKTLFSIMKRYPSYTVKCIKASYIIIYIG